VGAGCCRDHQGRRVPEDHHGQEGHRHQDEDRRLHRHQGERSQDGRRHQGDWRAQDRDHRDQAEVGSAYRMRSSADRVEVGLACPKPTEEPLMGSVDEGHRHPLLFRSWRRHPWLRDPSGPDRQVEVALRRQPEQLALRALDGWGHLIRWTSPRALAEPVAQKASAVPQPAGLVRPERLRRLPGQQVRQAQGPPVLPEQVTVARPVQPALVPRLLAAEEPVVPADEPVALGGLRQGRAAYGVAVASW
jgi:hypothetical protein